MAEAGDDLDLLLSLGGDGERVLETPPSSPRSTAAATPPRRLGGTDMSVFRDAVKDYLEPTTIPPASAAARPKQPKPGISTQAIVDKFSGLRIRNLSISPTEISNRFSDVRFVRISAIKNLIASDSFSGCWATVGVLLEKGAMRVSAQGKNYSIWKMGALDESEVSVFLFGDSHTHYSDEAVGAVFALFNGNVRMDNGGRGFSVSVGSAGQMLKMGVSADFGFCKGKRKDGMACTMVINKRKGAYCKFHTSKASQQYSTGRVELKGGNLQTAFKLRSEGIYMVNPHSERSNSRKLLQPVKVMSVDGLRKALSNADRVTTNNQSQGIRFLSHITANMQPTISSNGSTKLQQAKFRLEKRSASSGVSSIVRAPSKAGTQKKEQEPKRRRIDHHPENTIELDAVSSDDEINVVLRR